MDFNVERFGPLTNGLHREQRESGHLNDTTVTNDMIMEGDNATRMTLSSFQEFQLTGTEPVRKEAPNSCFTLLLGCIIFLNRWKKPTRQQRKSYFNTNSLLSAGFVVWRICGKWVPEPQKHFSSLVTSWPYITHHDVNKLREAEGTASEPVPVHNSYR